MKLKEIKRLSPDGKNNCPDAPGYAKGQWWRAVSLNEQKFDTSDEDQRTIFGLDEAVAKQQYGLSKYKGGIIVFSTDVNAVNDQKGVLGKVKSFFSNKMDTMVNRIKKNKKLANLIQKHNKEHGDIEDYFIGAFSVGNFFKGRYIGDNGKVYNEKSTSIEIAGVPSEVLLLLGIEVTIEFKQETVLIKDYNKDKFYLADRKRVKDASKEVENI